MTTCARSFIYYIANLVSMLPKLWHTKTLKKG